MIEINKSKQNKDEEVIILWIVTDNDDFSTLEDLIRDNSIIPVLFITNENLGNFPTIVREIYGQDYVF